MTGRAWVLFILSSVICWVLLRCLASMSRSARPSLGPVTASLVLAALALLPAAIATWPAHIPQPSAVWAIAVLGVVCTALGLIIFFRLIAVAGPGRASVITYVNPLVAVVVGVGILGESVGTVSIMGLLLILAGSYISTRGRAALE